MAVSILPYPGRTSNVFRPHYAEEQSLVILDLCLSKTRARKYHDYRRLRKASSPKRKAGVLKFLRRSVDRDLKRKYPTEDFVR